MNRDAALAAPPLSPMALRTAVPPRDIGMTLVGPVIVSNMCASSSAHHHMLRARSFSLHVPPSALRPSAQLLKM